MKAVLLIELLAVGDYVCRGGIFIN